MDIIHNYIEQGTGASLILLHGNGENHEYFINQIEYFSKEYHVIAPDTRGHGGTPRGTAPFTLKQFAEDLKNFLDEQKIEKAILLGFSDGGNIALLFTLKYPAYVDKLILNGADLNTKGVKRRIQILIELGYKLSKREMLGLMVEQPDIQPEELAKINTPTLVIAGTKDMIKDSHTRLIANSIPGSRLCIMSGTHFIAKERPQEFNEAVQQFLTENNK